MLSLVVFPLDEVLQDLGEARPCFRLMERCSLMEDGTATETPGRKSCGLQFPSAAGQCRRDLDGCKNYHKLDG